MYSRAPKQSDYFGLLAVVVFGFLAFAFILA